jgi:hypothetical protein
MDLTKLGWNADRNQQFAPHQAKGLVPARVAVEDKHFFRVWTAEAELLAQVTGHCLHEAHGSNAKLPKVGDWVANTDNQLNTGCAKLLEFNCLRNGDTPLLGPARGISIRKSGVLS